VADRSVSVLMTLSDLERRDARGHIFQADLLNNSWTVWSGSRTHVWMGTFIWCQANPNARGRCAPVLSILGVPFYFGIHPLTPNCQLWCGRACFQGVNPIPVRAGPQRSPILGVPL